MNAYAIALLAHSYVRWFLLLALLALLGACALGWRTGAPWSLKHQRLHAAVVGLADLQFTLGVLLYVFWSPVASAFFASPGTAMKEHTLRFFGLEHPTMMLIAVALLHIGRKRAQRVDDVRRKHRHATLWTLAAMLVILSSIPWPSLRHGRPLLRGMTSTSAYTTTRSA